MEHVKYLLAVYVHLICIVLVDIVTPGRLLARAGIAKTVIEASGILRSVLDYMFMLLLSCVCTIEESPNL